MLEHFDIFPHISQEIFKPVSNQNLKENLIKKIKKADIQYLDSYTSDEIISMASILEYTSHKFNCPLQIGNKKI